MSGKYVVFVNADGTTDRVAIDALPDRWVLRGGLAYERGDYAVSATGDEDPNAKGVLVYTQRPVVLYDIERERLARDFAHVKRALAAMPSRVPR